MEFPENLWQARHFKPVRSEYDNKEMRTTTIFFLEGLMGDPFTSKLGKNLMEYAHEKKMGFVALRTLDWNGLGPIQELNELEFDKLIDALVQALLNPKFALSKINQLLIVGFSLGGWKALLVALHERLAGLVGAVLLLEPAIGVLRTYYYDKLLALEAMGKTTELQALEAHEAIRLDGGFPMSFTFQRTSWDFGLGCSGLPLERLTVPVTVIAGEVKVEQIQELFNQIPAGNKKLVRVSPLQHGFGDKAVFASEVRPELDRLSLKMTDVALSDDERHMQMMEGLDKEDWALVERTRQREYIHHTTGHIFHSKDNTAEYEKSCKERNATKGTCGEPTEAEVRWTTGRTEVEVINEQQHIFDYTPPVQGQPQDE